MGPVISYATLFPWRIIMLFAYSFACFNIFHSFLKDKIHPIVTFLAIFGARIISSLIFFNSEKYNALGFPVFIIVVFLIALVFTEGKVLSKLIATVFYGISFLFTGVVLSILQIVVFLGKDPYEIYGANYEEVEFLSIFLVSIVCYIAFSFLFSGILKLFAARNSKQKHKKLYAYFTFLPLSHIFTMVIALFLAPTDFDSSPNFGITVNTLFCIFMGIIVIFDCSFPFVIDYFEKLEEEYNENKKELVKSTLNYQQTLFMKEERQQFRKIKHDFINLTATAKGFIEIGKPEKALAILSETNNDLTLSSSFYVCANDTLNTILYIKKKQADERKVNFDINVDETALLKIDDYSLCRVLHNMIDNAIEAAEATDEKHIKLDIIIDNDAFKINCQNSFYAKEKSAKRNNPERGNGIGIIKEIAKKYNGKFTCEKVNKIFHSSVYMDNISLN